MLNKLLVLKLKRSPFDESDRQIIAAKIYLDLVITPVYKFDRTRMNSDSSIKISFTFHCQ